MGADESIREQAENPDKRVSTSVAEKRD